MKQTRELLSRLEIIERGAWEQICNAMPQSLRQGLGMEAVRMGEALLTFCPRIDQGQFNRVFALGLDTMPVERVMASTVEQFKKGGLKNGMVQIPEGSDALEDVAKALGLVRGPRSWIKFLRSTNEPPDARTSLRILSVTNDMAQSFGAIVAVGFGMPPSMAGWTTALVGLPNWHCYLAYAGDKPVAGAALLLVGDMAWLGMGSTVPEERGKGAQAALLAHRIRHAGVLGCSSVTVETGLPIVGEAFPSFANILRAGFHVAYERSNWMVPPQ